MRLDDDGVTVHGKDAAQVHAHELTLEQLIDATTLERAATLPAPTLHPPRTVRHVHLSYSER
jgi:hypothetical protein